MRNSKPTGSGPIVIVLALITALLTTVAATPVLSANEDTQSDVPPFPFGPQQWVNLGNGRGYFNWIILQYGIAARTDENLYLETYASFLARNPNNSMFAAIGTAAFMRESAERRLRHALETLRNNDPAFFDVVMTDHDLALN